jgi:class 3 adenylate cyclase
MSIEAPPLERKLVAILAADVEGYSRLMHVDEEGTLATLSAHRRFVDDLISAAGGHITSTAGDSVLAEFASVVEAVVCAVEIQRSLSAANDSLPTERRMHFRVGINVGDVMVKDGGIFGDGVNVAARVEALARPGGICVTRGVRDHVQDRLPYSFEDLGDHSVKNIARAVHVYRLCFDEAREGPTEPMPRAGDVYIGEPTQTIAPEEVELAFWKSVETSGLQEEYEAYLDRYPEGTFAVLARARLAIPAAPAANQQDREVELAFWDAVKDSTEPEMLEAYLDKYPAGEFSSIAEIRLRLLASNAQ